MFSRANLGFLALIALALTSESAFGREQWLERDGRAVYLYPRRFGQEQPAVLQKIRDACPGAVCGTLAGQAVSPLLAAQPECTQQDMADAIIDASKQFDAATAAKMVAAAIEYRQVEKNTPPDFTTNPPTLRNSVFCQKAPKNAQLDGLVQAQDPANDPNIFFDPALKASVTKGSQANTEPFGGVANPPAAPSPSETPILTEDPTATTTDCPPAVTVTRTSTTTVVAASSTPPTNTAPAPPSGADFGSCTVPEIEFGVGFDNRKETSFQPTDKRSFNHGSAQNIAIITQFICDTLTNSCKANQAAKDVCATARQAAATAADKTGAQADAFNNVFGIKTNFGAVAVIDNQGKVVSPGSGSSPVPSQTATGIATPAPTVGSGIGNFGKCSIPQIEFGAGFDGRRETSFQPVDKASFNHGSAQNIAIITQFICDTLTNSCQADQTAKDVCATARQAAAAAADKTGAQADAFNNVFGIKTNFAAVAVIDNQGNVVSPGSGSGSAPVPSRTAPATATPAPTADGSGIGNFGKCSIPQIEFGAGFDGRRETSFQPVDKASFSHGSAQNIDIITRSVCDTLTNSCGADQTAKNTCAKGQAAASAAAKGTGAQADAFNAAFGISTKFASVTQIDDQGRVVGGQPPVTNNEKANTGAGANNSATTSAVPTPVATSAASTPPAAAGNLQSFSGALGGITAPVVTALGNGEFQVQGNASFKNQKNAVVRSCDVQNNQCANAANASGNKDGFTVSACNAQQAQCIAAAN